MSNKKFFHYRNAFKSDHLSSADIEELQENNNGVAILTFSKIQYFENRKVAGRTVDKGLVGFFKEPNTKPMIINSFNSKILHKFIGTSNVNEWDSLDLKVEFYVDSNVKLKGAVVGGIRIKHKQPTVSKEEPKSGISPKRFQNALAKIKAGEYSKEKLKEAFVLDANQTEQLNAI